MDIPNHLAPTDVDARMTNLARTLWVEDADIVVSLPNREVRFTCVSYEAASDLARSLRHGLKAAFVG